MVSKNAKIGDNVTIKEGVIVEDDVTVGDDCYIDYGCIIRSGVTIGSGSYIGPQCILGEFQMDFHKNRTEDIIHPLSIGKNALIRSHSVLYGGSTIGDSFQTGHHVTVREKTRAGKCVRLGSLTDIQGHCEIGDYVNAHSNVHIGMHSKIGNYVWIFPYCVFTNDPIPPSELEKGCIVQDYAVIATGTILLPGIRMGKHSFVGAGSVVTKDIPDKMFAVGCPAKIKGEVSQIKHPETSESAYPWPNRFGRYMPWQEIGFDAWSKNQCGMSLMDAKNYLEEGTGYED